MGFDCLCVLCAGPLGVGYIRFGSARGFALRKRREKVEWEKRLRRGEVSVVRKATGGVVPRKGGDEGGDGGGGEGGSEGGSEDEMVGGDQDEYENAMDTEETAGDVEEEEKQWEDVHDEFDSQFDDDEYQGNPASDSSDSSWESSSLSSSVSELETLQHGDMTVVTIQDVPLRPRTPLSESELDSEPESDAWSDDSDLTIERNWTPYAKDKPGTKISAFREQDTFDPTVLSLEEVHWVDRCRCLALNTFTRPNDSVKSTLGGKAFFSGRGRYEDYGTFQVRKPGRSHLDVGATEYCVNPKGNYSNADFAFSMHEACFHILERQILESSPKYRSTHPNSKRKHTLDKDVLFHALEKFCSPLSNRERDPENAIDQFWYPKSGSEYKVSDPGPQLSLWKHLKENAPPSIFLNPQPIVAPAAAASPPSSSATTSHDPFSSLPYDILFPLLLSYLPLPDILALTSASPHIARHIAPSDSPFWLSMLRTQILPWFWELRDPLRAVELRARNRDGCGPPGDIVADPMNFKVLFLWLEAATRPRFGMRGGLMGVANRRRIWEMVTEVVGLYEDVVVAGVGG